MIARANTTRGMTVVRKDPNNPLATVNFGSGGGSQEVVPSGKILLALQFWQGDKAQAMALSELIADIEPEVSAYADFLFIARFDCQHDVGAIEKMSRKFTTYHHTSPRRGTGWPMGCNDLTAGLVEYAFHKMTAGKMPHYKAIFALEADVVPLHRDWIKKISEAWDALKPPVYVAGRMLKASHIHLHVNGNALLSGNFKFLKWLLRELNSNSAVGWDYRLASQFKNWGWAEIPGMECLWNHPTLSEEQIQGLVNRGVVFLHGVKDYSVQNFARRTLL